MADAEPTDRAMLYQQLGLVLTYNPGTQKVLVEMNLNQHLAGTRGLTVSARGATRTISPPVFSLVSDLQLESPEC